MAAPATPEIIRLSTADLERLLEEKTATLARIRRLIGGKQSEKSSGILPGAPARDGSGPPKSKPKGHGRRAARDYPGAQLIKVPHPHHHVGDLCPQCLRGLLYLFKTPARIVHIVAQLFHHDDTHMRVQSLRQEIAADLTADPDARTGIFTTAILVRVGPLGIALFFTGRQHVEPIENFPAQCTHVIERLAEVYRFDEQAREQQLSELERLAFHQEHSRPVMEQLQRWMQGQLDQKQVEPNSNLGKAFNYMLKRWERFTRLLYVPGAPLDNNITEQALKAAILHRKNSLSYKTANGARVGDIFMSLIHTCALNQVNPFDYFMTLERHAEAVKKNPADWFPWNYHLAVAASAGSG